MPLVVFLKGVNVGGHRTFRPSLLAQELQLNVVNVGAAGTFVVRAPVRQSQLRTEIIHRLPFQAEVMICHGRDILRLTSRDPFAGQPGGPQVVRFVSVLPKRRPPSITLPANLPSTGRWGLKILALEGRFVLGLYRREMKAIGYLGQLERIFAQPVTTRSWTTMLAVAQILRATR